MPSAARLWSSLLLGGCHCLHQTFMESTSSRRFVNVPDRGPYPTTPIVEARVRLTQYHLTSYPQSHPTSHDRPNAWCEAFLDSTTF